MVFLAIEATSLLVALLSGAMYSRASHRGWQIALWGAAIILLIPSALAAFSLFFFSFFAPTFLPAAFLMFLAASFSLGVRAANGNADAESPPPIQTFSMAASQERMRLILGTVVAFLGGIVIIFLFQVSWVAILIALALSSISATVLILAPLSALVVPAAIWLGGMIAIIYNGATHAALADPIFWGGTLEFAGILIVIAVIPALIGVAIGTLLTRWMSGANA